MIASVNIDAFSKFADVLNSLHRSAFPIAIRGALNSAAFDVKTNTMPAEAASNFLQRQPNFFKANSKVEMAKGFDIKNMKAIVGFYENRLSNQSTNFAVKDLEQQEHGGIIGGKSFIPMRAARKGGTGVARNQFRLRNIKKIINAKNVRSISGWGFQPKTKSETKAHSNIRKQKLIRAAIKASQLYGANAYVLGNPNAAGSQTLFKVENVESLSGGPNKKLNIKLTPLYRVKKNRSVNVGGEQFMETASLTSGKKIEAFYAHEASKQIKKYVVKL